MKDSSRPGRPLIADIEKQCASSWEKCTDFFFLVPESFGCTKFGTRFENGSRTLVPVSPQISDLGQSVQSQKLPPSAAAPAILQIPSNFHRSRSCSQSKLACRTFPQNIAWWILRGYLENVVVARLQRPSLAVTPCSRFSPLEVNKET